MTAESASWPVAPYDVFRRELTIKGSFAQQFPSTGPWHTCAAGESTPQEW